MIFKSILLFQLIFISKGSAQMLPTNTVEIVGNGSKSLNQSPRCGGILNSSYKFTIAYKRMEYVEPNERCVWVSGETNATSYLITVSHLDIPFSLLITTVNVSGTVENYEIELANTEVLVENVDVLLITFFTGANETGSRRGFEMLVSTQNYVPNRYKENYILRGDSVHLKYPAMQGPQGYDVISAFVITPVLDQDKKFMTTELNYFRKDFWLFYDQVFNIFLFNRNQDESYKWEFVKTFRWENLQEIVDNRDLIMFMHYFDRWLPVEYGFYLHSESLADC